MSQFLIEIQVERRFGRRAKQTTIMLDPNGAAGLATASLTSSQVSFIDSLPKTELHAHLNGCIPVSCLQQLARDFDASLDPDMAGSIRETLSMLSSGVTLDEIQDFFSLFPAIYALTSTPDALRVATRAVLDSFLSSMNGEEHAQCSYLELRTTPRSAAHMSKRDYLLAVLSEVSLFENAALIVSVDRRMDVTTAEECVNLAIELRDLGHPVVRTNYPSAPIVFLRSFPKVGIDLCGDPTVEPFRFGARRACD